MSVADPIGRFLGHKRLALVGASRQKGKFGNAVLRELLGKGYELFVVHPQAETIEGQRCYRSLADLPPGIEGLILVVPPAQTEQLVAQAHAAGIKTIWMQQGAESQAAIDACRALGIEVVAGQCILMFADPQGIHRWHRGLWRLLGKIPKGI